MSNSPVQDLAAQDLSSGSLHTFPSRPFQPNSDPSASKRVCFYRSGDYKFSGHRMVINARTFKTFDALLDALSKKVPLPFGVRTITTPRGIHLVKGLEDLHDGGSYVCSDQRRVKPLNLAEVNRRQVPWNATRPLGTGRRRRLQFSQFGRNDITNRPTKVTERVTVRTPKRLLVIKNRDPTTKRIIVLQRKTAPTFDALLDYLSQILEFPVLKLFSTDGRRVDGLAALILCSGVVVAAGNEPFRLGNFSFHRTGRTVQAMYIEHLESSTIQPGAPKDNNKAISSGRGSRNFSLSSERHIVNQINKSKNGGMNSHMYQHHRSYETEVNRQHTAIEPRGTGRVNTELHACILPQDDDIEKSFRVNQDGSMTVEMKVRLTIKEEEMLQWTTTLSRHCLSRRTVCASISESANSSPDSNAAIAKDTSSLSEGDIKKGNQPNGAAKGVCFNDKHAHNSYSPKALGKAKARIKRTPTPGPRHVHKMASVGSVKMVTESGVQESSRGHYSYMERTADGETTEGFCVVRHSSGSSSRAVPRPRRTASAGKGNKGSRSSVRPSGAAEVLQIQNTGMEVAETVMHIFESQGCYDNYFVNEEYSADGAPLHGSTAEHGGRVSSESGPRSSSNDCDIDFSRQPLTSDSQQRLREEMLSLSSEPICTRREVMNDLSTAIEDDAQTATNSPIDEPVKQGKSPKSEESKKRVKPAANPKNSDFKKSKHSSSDMLSSNTSMGRKSLGPRESGKSGQRGKVVERKVNKPQTKKTMKDEKTMKSSALSDKAENVKITSPMRQTTRDNGHNVNTPSGRPPMKKNISDILQSKRSSLLSRKTLSKPKSISENRTPPPKKSAEFTESVSTPSLNPTPSEIHQYVQNWLESVGQDQDPYDEAAPDEVEPPSEVVFEIGGETDDEKNECQDDSSDFFKKSASCRPVPLYHEGPETSLLGSEQKTFCVSMPCVRVDEAPQGNQLKTHKSAEAIGPPTNESISSNSLSPKDKIKPVLRQLCSSIQNIRRSSDINTTSNLEKCNSRPDFQTQVGSVFGSSYKAFLSFLSVMTLRDRLAGSAQVDADQSSSTSEAMLMMQSLLKISAIEDKEEQRASLMELQSRTSSQLRDQWNDFQILRERLKSEPLSPKVSETEFALDVVSEGRDIFEDQHLSIEELMGELNIPQDLRAEISSTIQHARRFYPTEESTTVDVERNQSESEEDVEKFVHECQYEAKSTDPDDTRLKENNSRHDQGHGVVHRALEPEEADGTDVDVNDLEVAQTETSEAPTQKEADEEQEVDRDTEDKRTGDEEEETLIEDNEDQKTEKGSAEESVEKEGEGTEEVMTADEEEEGTLREAGEGVVEEKEGGRMEEGNHDEREVDSFVETDEREGVYETEKEETGGTDGIEEEEDEQESEDEEKQVDMTEEEADEMIKANGNIEVEDTEEEGEVAEVEYSTEEDVEAFIEEEEGEEGETFTDKEMDLIPEEKEEEAEKEETDEVDEVDNIIEYRHSGDESEEQDNTEKSLEEVEETYVEEIGSKDSMKAEDRQEEEEAAEDEEHGQPVGSEISSEHPCDKVMACDHLLEEASYLQQKSTQKSPTKSSPEGQSENTEGRRTDHDTGEGAELNEGGGVGLTHPVEISQELLDFVNSALLSSSLTFTYDARGNVRIEQDYARIIQTKPNISKRRRDSRSYGFKRLPSPNTSDLSDYRPDTSESGGYKTQDSIDLVSESGEEASDQLSPDFTSKRDVPHVETNLNLASHEEERFPSDDSGTKASKEDLSYCSASSSLKADAEPAQCISHSSEKDTGDGVLIDRGRWLLKENHLIRKSPPVALGMYGDVDSTSTDSGQENNAEDSPRHPQTQPNPLVAISSSELEDMAKPPTPKCTYFNMPHGSDSDPFQEDSSLHSVKRDLSSVTARGFKVSPTINTSRTWPNKVGSLSSFASVEFKLADGRVHPEGERSAVTQPRGTSSGASNALQAHDSLETLHERCGQYCPIL